MVTLYRPMLTLYKNGELKVFTMVSANMEFNSILADVSFCLSELKPVAVRKRGLL